MTLANKTVVVLGGSSGIGLATAKAAKDEGAHVIITGRSQARLDAAIKELGTGARAVALDVADEAGMRAFFGDLKSVDHIFITAATVTVGTGLASDSEALRPGIDTRLWGSWYAAKFGAPKMPADGSIIFTSGVSGVRPRPGAGLSSASCGAVEALARTLAVELAPIRVNTIVPGFIDTPLIAEVLGAHAGAIREQMAKRLPVRRVGRGQDIAEAALFLMKNGFTTGITLTVDGGHTLV
ncbi:MAG TPA: SDR family oxidoreductase [Candidatus Binataceae bacterium]|nr:SDR family oxidoreductase [Candidatus Binataceae bacterium]